MVGLLHRRSLKIRSYFLAPICYSSSGVSLNFKVTGVRGKIEAKARTKLIVLSCHKSVHDAHLNYETELETNKLI